MKLVTTCRGVSAPYRTPEWFDQVVQEVRSQNPEAEALLYQVLHRGFQYYLYRHVHTDQVEDEIQEIYMIVLRAIRENKLRSHQALLSYARRVVKYRIVSHIEDAIDERKHLVQEESWAFTGLRDTCESSDPDKVLELRQKIDLVKTCLNEMPARDRELLTRFYLLRQSEEFICREMNLNATQFRLNKSRAKERFGQLGQRKVERRGVKTLIQELIQNGMIQTGSESE
jgi:RNA polymerase sigma factor (sigma-70 family)